MSRHARGVDLRLGRVPRWARPTPLLLLGLWLLLRSLAAASPPDPVWLAGVYDGADFDDVVVRIGLQAASHEGAVCLALAPDPTVQPLASPRCRSFADADRLAVPARSPPLA